MSLVQTLLSQLEATLLYIAATVSHFEADILHIPPSLRFFTAGAEPDLHFRQAFLFVLAPLHAFVSMPLSDLLLGRCDPEPRSHGLRRYGTWFLWYLVMFWVATLIVGAPDMYAEQKELI
ncbi:hypothetical protein K469DRAFT_705996 [Zopfia rhizophila CBS 207.26]|uniref:Uncharacterized protein n=1 Tax=Zopfia rhizophila CBS 207.26 TaxID=1314779 RepID=A0A6A6EQR0_9PEZI|nr:hypothetical protein K469DRAFT_705996 [Zopfia rhizophila CBS 207.26]